MTPNLHVALALALGRPTSDSDAALVERVYALRLGRAEPDPPETVQRCSDVPLFDLDDTARGPT